MEKLWRQVAKIMGQLASTRLPKIGSIIRNEADPGSFVVGPLIETDSGPYDSAAEFYEHYPLALGKSLGRESGRLVGKQSWYKPSSPSSHPFHLVQHK